MNDYGVFNIIMQGEGGSMLKIKIHKINLNRELVCAWSNLLSSVDRVREFPEL